MHEPFIPAVAAPDGTLTQPAIAECRTSDITLAEFETLCAARWTQAGVSPRRVFPQSFGLDDVVY